MSQHNNSLNYSSKGKCKCGRNMSIGEDKAGVSGFGYECPDCKHRKYAKPLTPEEFYEQFKR